MTEEESKYQKRKQRAQYFEKNFPKEKIAMSLARAEQEIKELKSSLEQKM